MKIRWLGMSCLFLVALVIIVYKQHSGVTAQEVSTGVPSVLLVADLREAEEAGDRCADMIKMVRNVKTRGVKVEELMPESTSPLIKEYHVVVIPTVILIGKDGHETDRFEGEGVDTVAALAAKLDTLNGN